MAEDFNQLKRISKRLVYAQFQHPWEFRLHISGLPVELANNFDLLVKDISYGPVTIETETIKAGGVTLTFPAGSEPVTLTMTVRDFKSGVLNGKTVNRPFYHWVQDAWVPRVINKDGTFNLPSSYLRRVARVSLYDPDDAEVWYMFPQKLGDITESVDGEGFLEFPVTFIQFRSQEWAGNANNINPQ